MRENRVNNIFKVKIYRCIALFLTILVLGLNVSESVIAAENEGDVNSESNEQTLLDDGESIITRLQWWKMLIDAFHMSVDADNYPDNYFSDLDCNDPNYRDIMVATEFGLVDVEAGDEVGADKVATREFAAHTLNLCVGFVNQNQEYSFQDMEDIVYLDDAQIAIDKGWFVLLEGKFLPNRKITQNEYDQLSLVAQNSYEAMQVSEDYDGTYTLKNDVKMLGELNAELTGENELTIVGESLPNVVTGEKFAILYGGMPFVYKASEVKIYEKSIVIKYEDVEMEEAFEDIDMEVVNGIDLSDISIENSENAYLTYVVGGTPEKYYSDGVEYESLEEINEEEISAVKVYYGSKGIDIKSTGSLEWKVNDNTKIKASITISNLEWTSKKKLIPPMASFDFNGDLDVYFGVEHGLDKWQSFDLETIKKDLSITVKLGLLGYFKIEPEIALDGKISVKMSEKIDVGVIAELGDVRFTHMDFRKKDFTFNAAFEAKLGVKAELGFDIGVLKGYIFAKIGAKAKVKDIFYEDDRNPCEDISAYLYCSVGATIKVNFVVWSGSYTLEAEIWDSKNSPVRLEWHIEDGKSVEECTRKYSETDNEGETGQESHIVTTSVNPNIKSGRYYTPVDSKYGNIGLNSGTGSNGLPFTRFEYTLSDSQEATITKFNGSTTALVIPETIDGYLVVKISDGVFQNNKQLVYVDIADSVTAIGVKAFAGCVNLKSLKLPSNIKSLGYGCFLNCGNLSSVTIPKNLSSITGNSSSFDYTGIFAGCSSLENVELEEGMTYVCRELFYNCSGIKKIVIPDTVTTIGYGTFRNCTNLESVVMPDAINTINGYAFAGCGKLKDVGLPKSLTYLGQSAFANDVALTGIVVPKGLKTVEETYRGGYSVKYGPYVTADGPLNNAGPFEGCSSLKMVDFEEGITSIPAYLFSHCSGLEEVDIPETVTYIGTQAFDQCINIKTLILHDGLATIDEAAFANLSNLENISFPSSVTAIGIWGFAGNKKLTEVDLPIKLAKIGKGAFYNCPNLEQVTIHKEISTVLAEKGPFIDNTSIKKVILEDGMTSIPAYLFEYCKGLESFEMPNSITEIGNYAFRGCSGIKELNIPDSVTTIYNFAFMDCTALEKIIIPDSVTGMGTNTFSGCTALKMAKLPKGRITITNGTFKNCSSLKTVNIPDNVKTIGDDAFYNTAIPEIELPSNVNLIGKNAFRGCKNLKSVTLNDALTSIGNNAFYDCDALKEITIPNNVTSLGTYAFADCEILEKVELGSGLTEIPAYAFNLCPSITDMVIPYRVSKINNNAFTNCVGLVNITIPRAVSSMGDNVFSYPTKMTVYGVAGTYAEQYANEKGMTFVNQEIPVTELKLDKDDVIINKNATTKLNLVVIPDNFTDAITWKSNNESIVTVDDNGKITAKAVGNAIVRVTAGDNSASCKVTVVQPVTSISLNTNYSNSQSLEALETFQLVATVNPSNAFNKEIQWKSSDDSIASVDENGLVTAHKKGEVTITVTSLDGSNVSNERIFAVTNDAHICSVADELESPHKYENNCSDFWIYSVNGAKSLSVTFDEKTHMEDDFDFIFLYDALGNQVGKYTGSELAGKTIRVDGDAVKIKLQSDEAGNDWGFKVLSVEINKEDTQISVRVGDVNGDGTVNRADRMYLARAIAGWEGYDLPSCEVADFNGDGEVNRADRMYLARAIAGWEGYIID